MQAYENLNQQYIDGVWRDGHQDDTIQDLNPYDNSVLLSIKCASLDDLHEAYAAAHRAAPIWAGLLPQPAP